METKMKDGVRKSTHKYFGLGRFTSTFGAFALVALVYTSMMSGIASGANGIPFQLDELMGELQTFEARFEVLAQEIEDNTSDGIADVKNAVIDNTDDAEANINQFIRDTHLVDPFDVAVNICAEIEGGAAIEGLAGLGISVTLDVSAGIDFYGNGAEIGLAPAGEIGAGLSLGSGIGTTVTACINGIFARQNQDLVEEDVVIASVDAGEQAFVTELFETGNIYRNRIMGTAKATSLVVVSNNGQDRLNTSLDGFEGFTTLDAEMLGKFLVNSFDGSGNTPLDYLVADLSGVGSGVGTVLSDLAGVVDLSSGSVGSIGGSIVAGVSTLGFGSGYGDGLNVLTGLDLFAITSALDSFKGIGTVVNTVGGFVSEVASGVNSLGSVIGGLEDAIEALNDVIHCLKHPLDCL